MDVAGNWAGKVYGTNTGNLFIKLVQEGTGLTGEARFLDASYGPVVFSLRGEVNEKIQLTLTPIQSSDGAQVEEITVTAQLQSDSTLTGEWSSMLGTGGTFQAWPHHYGKNVASDNTDAAIPEQVFNRSIPVRSIRLYQSDVIALLDVVRRDFMQGRMIVTYQLRGSDVTKYVEDFHADLASIESLRALKLSIQEPDAHGINRMVVVDLVETGESAVRVSGVNETWVVGKAESIKKAVEPYENSLVTNYRKYGLNLNSLIFLAMVAVTPDIATLANRALFIGLATLLLVALYWSHKTLIPNTLVLPETKRATYLGRIWPSALSWIIAVTSSVAASWIYSLLTKSP